MLSLSIRRLTPIVLLCAGMAACTSASPASPSNTAPFSQTDIRVGSGAAAANGQTVSVNYTGWFYDASKPDHKGLTFDTNAGKAAFSFILGNGQVIAGWDQGVPGMQMRGLRQLVIPPSLAYGSKRNNSIPANSTLLFEIELLSAQ